MHQYLFTHKVISVALMHVTAKLQIILFAIPSLVVVVFMSPYICMISYHSVHKEQVSICS